MSMIILMANIDKVPAEYSSSHRRYSNEKVFIEISQISLEKNLCGSLFVIKFIHKKLQNRCFPVKFWKILTPILKNMYLWTTVSENISRVANELHLKDFAF